MMRVTGDTILFSTGKAIYAHNGVIGLSEPDERGWEISEGFDGGVYMSKLTKKEKAELASYMISLWQRFKDEI